MTIRGYEHLAVVRLLDEVVEHLLSNFEVRDDAVFEGADSDNVSRRAPQHIFGFASHRLDVAVDLVESDNRGLVDHYTLAAREHQSVGGAKVNREIGGENAEQRTYIHRSISNRLLSVGNN